MLKLAAAAVVASAVVFFVAQRAQPAAAPPPQPAVASPSQADAPRDPDRADPAAATPPARPVTGVRRFASAAERARLGEAIARARQHDGEAARTYDFSGSPVPRAAAATDPTRPPGDLDKAYIRERMQEIVPLLGECYELALERVPDLAGTLAVDFVIDAEEEVGGYVREAGLAEGSDLADAEMVECVTETILSVEFVAPPGGGTVRVTYPFRFAPAPPEPPAP